MLSIFLSAKKREEISDQIDDLLMKQYYCRCRIEEDNNNKDQHMVEHEKHKITNYEQQIEKLRKKLR